MSKRAEKRRRKREIEKFDDINKAFMILLALPTMVVEDKFEDLKEPVVDGRTREQRFVDYVMSQYECLVAGTVTLEELYNYIIDELGITFEFGGKR